MNNKITYRKEGDYFIPNLSLPIQPKKQIGKYGRLRLNYLKDFKKGYNVNNFSAMNYEENRYKVNYFIKEVQSIYKDRVRNEVKEYNYINEDVNTLNIDIDYDRNLNSMKERIISYYEPETKTRSSSRIIEILKEKLTKMLERIVKLVHIQDSIYIKDKNKIDIETQVASPKLNFVLSSLLALSH